MKIVCDYIPITKHIVDSSSREEFFNRCMEDVIRIASTIDTPKKARKLIREIVFAKQVEQILHYEKPEIISEVKDA